MDQKRRVLLVDDQADFREIFTAEFTRAGFDVQTAENGEEGLAKAKAQRPDLIVLDMRMPGLSGADVALKLKDDPETKDLKIVFLTMYGDPVTIAADELFARQMGAVGYFKKSEDIGELTKKIGLLLSAS